MKILMLSSDDAFLRLVVDNKCKLIGHIVKGMLQLVEKVVYYNRKSLNFVCENHNHCLFWHKVHKDGEKSLG